MTSDGVRAAFFCLLLASAQQGLADEAPRPRPAISEGHVTKQRPHPGPHRTPSGSEATIMAFTSSPYPFPADGIVPADPPNAARRFFESPIEPRFHNAPRGGKLFETTTYSDNRSLLLVPPHFDPASPDAMLVLFLHGNLATLETVEGRQHVPRQVLASGANAVLVAPALAKNALDSSPGRFYERNFFDTYLDEASVHLSDIAGRRFSPGQIANLPVVIVAYSGGYLATAFSLHYASGSRKHRIAGVILLDALFGETKKFEDWLVASQTGDLAQRPFFVSASSAASAGLNRQLRDAIAARGIRSVDALPTVIGPGTIVFQASPAANHTDFVTMAWTPDPLEAVLGTIRF